VEFFGGKLVSRFAISVRFAAALTYGWQGSLFVYLNVIIGLLLIDCFVRVLQTFGSFCAHQKFRQNIRMATNIHIILFFCNLFFAYLYVRFR